ncbi:hypothetical protein PHMEG_00018454 [Phytophthora megakarya]|uniref:Reverse transcriptase domain-containing protein n=1 Tax=Phytophthora megakarya TaxID=4795 RepID=A0A225VVV3_9STRA|nr:hypothetical protein PHMEG_00018454 [Phytophthora megakarya]
MKTITCKRRHLCQLSEGAVVSVGHSAGARALARNLAEKSEEAAGPAMDSNNDGSDGAKPSAATGKATSQSTGFRPPTNGATPGANKIIDKTLELMMTKSSWMQMFGPTLVRQAVCMNLGGDLVVPIDSTSTRQVAQDTVMLFRAMGCEPQRFPSDAALNDGAPADAGTALRKWKEKLCVAFGVEEIAPGACDNRSGRQHAGVDVVLGTHFMIPADVRLDLLHGTVRLPDEVTVPLVKPAGAADDEPYGAQVVGGPTEDFYVPRGPDKWYRRMESRRGKPVWIRLTNVSDETARCYKHSSVVLWIPRGELPREVGYARLDSSKYNEWQVLAYAEGRDETLLQKEKELYEYWLAEQPPGVERKEYTMPARILARPPEDSVAPRTLRLDHSGSVDREFLDAEDDETNPAEDSVDMLELTYISVMQEIEAEIASGNMGDDDDFLFAWLTEPSSTVLDYAGPSVTNESLSGDEQRNIVEVLKRHEGIKIASGNALPPPAYGVVCDIDVQGHMPIKQRARRTPLRVLEKLYELLKGLLRAGLITFSDSPWASPIVIVLKTNGVDIRLCIDYKRVNAVTTIMEYAMPLVNDLLTDMEAYLWFCSLDAASGIWAVMMTERARKVSAFVCALGHFEWRRMPFGFKNATMIYQRMMDNALWGFVQPKGGWKE